MVLQRSHGKDYPYRGSIEEGQKSLRFLPFFIENIAILSWP